MGNNCARCTHAHKAAAVPSTLTTTNLMKHTRTRPRGQTLLELIGATTVIALALVPALRIMRDTIRVGRDTESSNLSATFAASKLEEHLMLTAGTFTASTVTGNFSADGY